MHGDAHPNVGYFWRVEPDVIFAAAGSAPLSPLLIGAAHSLAEVLLPQTTSQAQTDSGTFSQYPHFQFNHELLQDIPRDHRVWALVSVGRYSASYIRRLEAEKGDTGSSDTKRSPCRRGASPPRGAPGSPPG